MLSKVHVKDSNLGWEEKNLELPFPLIFNLTLLDVFIVYLI